MPTTSRSLHRFSSLLLVLQLVLVGCEGGTGNGESPPSSEQMPAALALGATEVTMRPGEGFQLNVGVTGGQGLTLSTLGYESLVPAVATVSATGLIDAVAVGSTTIRVTATFLPGGTTSRAELFVRVAPTSAPSITLGSTPPTPTTDTTALFRWTVSGATESAVRCRRDTFPAGVCPNPFVLGAQAALAPGPHRVDFWVDDGSGTLDLAQPLTSYQWTIVVTPPPPSIQLSGVPAASTTQTSASLGYEVMNPLGGESVFCRLDAYTPIACPNPFRLGAQTPLAAGAHTVDFYLLAAGATLDPNQATLRVSWTIVASSTAGGNAAGGMAGGGTAAGGTAGGGGVAGGGSAGVTALPAIPYSLSSTTIDGVASSYDGTRALTWNGNVMLGPVADPAGSGRTVNLHRIMQAAPYAWGTTHRCELMWGDEPNYSLPPGVDTWQAFAVMRKVGENLPPSTSDDAMLVFQSHSPERGDTYPPYALVFSRQTGTVSWEISYNSRPVSQWSSSGDVEGYSTPHSEPLMPEGQWYRYIVHYRAGFLASHNPLIEVWRARPSGQFELLFRHTGLNAYNGGDGYPRIGPYKWDSAWRGQPSLAFYETPIYYGRGANLFANAAASLMGL